MNSDSASLNPHSAPPAGATLGLIAGNGCFPAFFVHNATAQGHRVVVVAHRDETAEQGLEGALAVGWIRVGQLRRMIAFLQKHGVRDVAFLGGIRKTRLLKTLRPDWLGMRFLCSLATTNDNELLSSLLHLLEKRGMRVFDPSSFLGECRAPRGVFSARQPSPQELAQGSIGWKTAQLLGQADVGQGVVVAAGSVVAVEAVEGTDELLKRAGSLIGRHHGVLVKRVKPQQDLRLDLPTIGPTTVRNAAEASVRCIVVEAGHTLLVDPMETVRLADQLGVCLIGGHGAELTL
ncbi:MAG: UDP-2,3-diacylglucosamine diphosphatase LpxI [Bdellovibrionota bacterium]|nr:MAG: UDP-2,3-diacylglucosamine diphosphatase LpxI [Bdellovibrionota bacterium]